MNAERGSGAAESPAGDDLLAASQAGLIGIVAAMYRGGPADSWQAGMAFRAFRHHDRAGFTFGGE